MQNKTEEKKYYDTTANEIGRILEYIKPTYVHMMICGKIVKTGDYNLAFDIEKNGYSDTFAISGNETNE